MLMINDNLIIFKKFIPSITNAVLEHKLSNIYHKYKYRNAKIQKCKNIMDYFSFEAYE